MRSDIKVIRKIILNYSIVLVFMNAGIPYDMVDSKLTLSDIKSSTTDYTPN